MIVVAVRAVAGVMPLPTGRTSHPILRSHREVLQHYLGDLIYGANDGIVTTFAVVAGVAGADLSPRIVLILGISNLLADGFSMGASNYLAIRSRSSAELQVSGSISEPFAVGHGICNIRSFRNGWLLAASGLPSAGSRARAFYCHRHIRRALIVRDRGFENSAGQRFVVDQRTGDAGCRRRRRDTSLFRWWLSQRMDSGRFLSP